MSISFDPSPYTRAPLLNVASAVTLGTALLAALPKKPEARIAKAAKRLQAAVAELQQVWKESDAKVEADDSRSADQAIDNAYANLFARLQAYAALDSEHHPRANRAAELASVLFPTGLAFLKLPYAEEWAESQKRLDRVESDGLAKELDELAGKEFLAEVRRLHIAYGVAIGVTQAKKMPATEAAKPGEPLRKVAQAVVLYASQVSSLYDPDEPETLDLIRRCLAPIDDLRQAQARRSSATGEVSPPPVPAGPAVPTSTVNTAN